MTTFVQKSGSPIPAWHFFLNFIGVAPDSFDQNDFFQF